MKKIFLLALIIILPLLTACTQINLVNQTMDVLNVDEKGNTSFNKANLNSKLDSYNYAELTDKEKEGILYMIEEEKLAHDVYAYLYEKWNLKIFNNISSSEQTHTESVQSLAAKYNLNVPTTINKLGQYENADLQKLYDNLTLQGSQSLDEALRVGAAIEEIDILDLEKYISETDKDAIKMVYENLMKGSRNHLRSFVSNLGSYSAQYLNESAYNDIISADIEKSNGQGNSRSGKNNN